MTGAAANRRYRFSDKGRATYRRWYRTNRAACIRKARAWGERHPVEMKAHSAKGIARRRAEALMAYGARCLCCGEKEPVFLTLDHIGRDGKNWPKHLRSGDHLVRWARKHGYPPSLRVLCYNCNCGRERNGGACPHKNGVR